ncbi:hypothetical protein EHS15_09615 [Leptospira idonii]|uniref:Uncharacterized protein n=2 Tax=Leptospira idonii TaxID=1193500 RepID=A0A4R9M0M4_9LEPT|nr:hypothetical protein EHS15_09615 [Leptospira idonii]
MASNSLDSQGKLLPIQIELVESAGPVSPQYQYDLNLNLKNHEDGLLLKYSYVGEFVYGVPEKKIVFESILSKEKSIEWIDRLLELKPLGIQRELPDNVKNNVGISFNSLHIEIGASDKTKIMYTLGDLRRPEFANETKIIQFLKESGIKKV